MINTSFNYAGLSVANNYNNAVAPYKVAPYNVGDDPLLAFLPQGPFGPQASWQAVNGIPQNDLAGGVQPADPGGDPPRYLAGVGRASYYSQRYNPGQVNPGQSNPGGLAYTGGLATATVTNGALAYNGIPQNDVAGGVQPADPGGDSAEFSAAAKRILDDMESIERKMLTADQQDGNAMVTEGLDLGQTLGSLSPSERRRLLPLLMMQGAPLRRIDAAGHTASPEITNARLAYLEDRYRQVLGG